MAYTAKRVSQNTTELYDAFVTANSHTFLQSRHWGEWQDTNGRTSTRYMVFDNKNEENFVLTAQLLRHPLPLGKYYLYCPYGPTVNKQPTVNNLAQGETSKQLEQAVAELLHQLQKDFPDCLFVKLEPQLPLPSLHPAGYTLHASSRIQPASTLILDLTRPTEQLLQDMHPKNRYNIRVAEKHGVKVVSGSDLQSNEASEILKLILETTERQGYHGHSDSYYRNFFQFFSKTQKPEVPLKTHWSAAYLEGEMLAGAIFLDFGETRDFLFGGSKDLHREAMASFLMQWQSIQDAKQKGFKKYDFGGTETSSGQIPGFVRFKLRFGGTQVTYPKAVDTTWHLAKYFIYNLAKKVLR